MPRKTMKNKTSKYGGKKEKAVKSCGTRKHRNKITKRCRCEKVCK